MKRILAITLTLLLTIGMLTTMTGYAADMGFMVQPDIADLDMLSELSDAPFETQNCTNPTFSFEDGFGLASSKAIYMETNTAATATERRVAQNGNTTVNAGETYFYSVWVKSLTENMAMGWNMWYGEENKVNGTSGLYAGLQATTYGQWTQITRTVTVNETAAADASVRAFLRIADGTGGNGKDTKNYQFYMDGWYIIRADSPTSTAHTRAMLANEKISYTGALEIGTVLSASATARDANPNVTPTLSYQWQRSENGSDYTDISGATAANYALTNADERKYVRAKITATSVGTVSGTSTMTATTFPVFFGEVKMLTADDFEDPSGRRFATNGPANSKLDWGENFGLNGTGGACYQNTNNYAADRRVNFSDLQELTLKTNKVYHAVLWIKSNTDSNGFAINCWHKGATTNLATGNYAAPSAPATKDQWKMYRLDLGPITWAEKDKVSYKLQDDGTLKNPNDSSLLKTEIYVQIHHWNEGAAEDKQKTTAADFCIDEGYVIEEESATSTNYTKPFVTDPQISSSAVLTASATVSDVNPNATPTLSYQWQRSENGINFVNIDGETSASYQPVATDAQKYLRAEITATSVGSISGISMASVCTDAIQLQDSVVTIETEEGSSIYVPATETHYTNGQQISLPAGHSLEFVPIPVDKKVFDKAYFNGAEVSANFFAVGDGTLRITYKYINGAADYYDIAVSEPLTPGKTATLKTTFTSTQNTVDNGTIVEQNDVVYTAEDPEIVSIDGSTITGRAPGMTKVTASVNGSPVASMLAVVATDINVSGTYESSDFSKHVEHLPNAYQDADAATTYYRYAQQPAHNGNSSLYIPNLTLDEKHANANNNWQVRKQDFLPNTGNTSKPAVQEYWIYNDGPSGNWLSWMSVNFGAGQARPALKMTAGSYNIYDENGGKNGSFAYVSGTNAPTKRGWNQIIIDTQTDPKACTFYFNGSKYLTITYNNTDFVSTGTITYDRTMPAEPTVIQYTYVDDYYCYSIEPVAAVKNAGVYEVRKANLVNGVFHRAQGDAFDYYAMRFLFRLELGENHTAEEVENCGAYLIPWDILKHDGGTVFGSSPRLVRYQDPVFPENAGTTTFAADLLGVPKQSLNRSIYVVPYVNDTVNLKESYTVDVALTE